MYLLGGPIVAVYVKQGLYMLWYWHRKKESIWHYLWLPNLGKQATPARLKFKPLVFQHKKFAFCLQQQVLCFVPQ